MPAIVVRELATQKEIHRIEMQPPFTERAVECVLMGLLINMDSDRYYADESECDEWVKKHAEERGR